MSHDEDDLDLGYDPHPTGSPTADPAALAIASLVLGTLSLGGLGLLNGASYVLPLVQGATSTVRIVLAGLLGAAFAAAAAVLGAVAARRTDPEDPDWVPRLAHAGVLVAGTACVLRLVATVVSAAQVGESGWFAPL